MEFQKIAGQYDYRLSLFILKMSLISLSNFNLQKIKFPCVNLHDILENALKVGISRFLAFVLRNIIYTNIIYNDMFTLFGRD